MASTAVEVFTHVFSCCLSRRGSRRDLVVRSLFFLVAISFLALTLHGHSFCFFLRFLTLVVIFHLTFVRRLSVHAYGAWIWIYPVPLLSFLLHTFAASSFLKPTPIPHSNFSVHAQGKLPSYNVKHSPVLFDHILCLTPASSSSFQFVHPHLTKTRI